YAFNTATGALLTCCSCRVPPNTLRTMSGPNLGAAVVGAGQAVIKALASVPSGTNTCDARVAPSGNGFPGGYASGMIVTGTHLPFLFPSDVVFTAGALTTPEQTRLTTACAALPVANQCTCAGGI